VQGSPGVHLDIALLPTTLASSVFKRFCKQYSLSEQDCQLSCDGQVVELKKRLHEVYQIHFCLVGVSGSHTRARQHSTIAGLQLVCLLQFPGSSTGSVCLEAILRPSAALHIWQAYHQANLSDANAAYLAGIWEGATGQFVKAYRRQAEQPSPLQIAAAIQEAKPSLVMFDSSRLGTTHATYLPAVQDAVRPLFQLTQVLLSQSGFCLSCDSPERQLEFMQRLSSNKRIDEAPKDTELTRDHAAHQERRIVLLQSTLLLLKLVTFMSAVEAKSSSTDVAKEVLWQILANMGEEGGSELTCPNPRLARNPASASLQHEVETERDVSVPLAALLCTTLRQHILQPTIHADICCRLIEAVLLESSDVIDSQKAQRLAAIFKSKGTSFRSTCSCLLLLLASCALRAVSVLVAQMIRCVHSSDMLCVFAEPHSLLRSSHLHAVRNLEA